MVKEKPSFERDLMRLNNLMRQLLIDTLNERWLVPWPFFDSSLTIISLGIVIIEGK